MYPLSKHVAMQEFVMGRADEWVLNRVSIRRKLGVWGQNNQLSEKGSPAMGDFYDFLIEILHLKTIWRQLKKCYTFL